MNGDKRTKNLSQLFLLLTTVIFFIYMFYGCENNKPSQHFTIGVVNMNSKAETTIKGFREGLTSLGYTEGQNITFVYPGLLKTVEEAEKTARLMIDQGVDLIYAISTPATKKALAVAKESNTPIIFGPVHSPLRSGLIKSIDSPGANVTGVRAGGSEAKTLAWLLMIKPDVKKIYVPLHIGNGPAKNSYAALKVAAEKLHVELISRDLSNAKELGLALQKIPPQVDALWVVHSHLLLSNIKSIVESAASHNLLVATPGGMVGDEVLLSYGPNDLEMGKQLSLMANKILQGFDAESIPFQTAEFFLGINLKQASEMGIAIPDQVINQADTITRN